MSLSGCRSLCTVSPHEIGARILRVDAADIAPDALALDALAQLALLARRCGYRLIVQGASSELSGLIELAGLTEALGIEPLRPSSVPDLCLETRRQSEERK